MDRAIKQLQQVIEENIKTIERLDSVIENQNGVIRGLSNSQRRSRVVMTGLAGLLVLVGGLAWYGWNTASNVDALRAQGAADQEANRIDSCRRRNSAQQVGRMISLQGDVNTVNRLIEPLAAGDPANAEEIFSAGEDIISKITSDAPQAAALVKVDTDCDRDGMLTTEDYFDSEPPGLPVEVPPPPATTLAVGAGLTPAAIAPMATSAP